uniref:C2H2-type domain-containing protein n=1 Tax=Mola mola TaxID=94237 RepID=A0A3Q3W191_MOLML
SERLPQRDKKSKSSTQIIAVFEGIPNIPEECRFSVSAEVPWNCQTSTDDNKNNCIMETVFKVAEIKMEQEEVGVDSEEQKLHIPAPNVVTSEQDQPTIQEEPHETRADSSDCSEGPTEDSDSYDEDLEEQRGKLLQAKSGCVAQDDKFNTNNQKSRNFCRFCGKGFQYVAALMRHIKTHDKNTDCAVCGKASRTTAELLAHLKRHHSKVDFCNICGETFPNVHFLRLHEKKHTGEKDFTCRECGRVFNRRHHLIVHVRSHSGEKPYSSDCSEGPTEDSDSYDEDLEEQRGKLLQAKSGFQYVAALMRHIKTHDKNTDCAVCGKASRTTAELLKDFTCRECGRVFNRRHHLIVHVRSHSGEKPYHCDICGKGFSQSQNVKIHKIIHSGERPHQCGVCGKLFPTNKTTEEGSFFLGWTDVQ